MKTTISTDGDFVSAHFGRCPQFTIVEIDDGVVVNKEIMNNPGHHPGYLPEFFHKMGVTCIIAGGMGMNAKNLFDNYKISQFTGISGKIDDVIAQLTAGTLVAGDSFCNPDSGKGYGVDKSVCDHEGSGHGGEQ